MKYCFTNLSISAKKLLLPLAVAIWCQVSFGQTTYTVTSTADTPDADLTDNICADANGDCTFRAALQNANKTPQKDIIAFDIPGQGPFYIRPDGIYNNIVQPLVIDGTTQLGWSVGKPVVVIDGSNVPIREVGLRIRNNASGCIIKGLVMGGYRIGEDGYGGFAITIETNDNIIEGNYFGTDADGETPLPNSRGVQIMNASNNLVGGEGVDKRNLFSGNRAIGLAIFGNEEEPGPNSYDNRVVNNYFGTNASGTTAVPNNNNIQVSQSAKGTIIHGNLISGANFRGIVVASEQTSGTKITGNLIGTDHTGTQAIPNNSFGINLISGTNNTVIGGSQPEDRNIIAGNGNFGIGFQVSPFAPGNLPVKENQVLGNYIGLDINGQPLPNESGILIVGLSEENTIGGIIPNVISGNSNNGVLVIGENAFNNIIKGNFIGVDVDGENAIPNGSGISIQDSQKNTVGGTLPEEKNIISGNSNHGVILNGGGENQIVGNHIGLSPSGDSPIANGQSGIYIFNSTDNVIGGDGASNRNIISGNTGAGITIAGEESVNNSIMGNHIGTDIEGSFAIPNNFGISISNGSSNNIGGLNASERNIISGNTQDGIRILGASATQNRIIGNLVGTDESGAIAIPNQNAGIVISNAGGTLIGGRGEDEGNVISGNNLHGVIISGGASNNRLLGNYIGATRGGLDPMPNSGNGVHIIGASNNNTIGGLNTGEANTIAYNGAGGILITRGPQGNADPLRNRVSGNRIFNNQLSGIGLDTPDITPNDPGDADTGPNQLQNFPEIADDISLNGLQVSLRYFVPSSPDNSAFPIQVEFFVDDGNRQGRNLVYVDQFTEQDYNSGDKKELEFTLPNGVTFESGDNIVATATDQEGNTSEFGSGAPQFSLEITVSGQGTVDSDPPLEPQYRGTEMLLTPIPDTGWQFLRWEGDYEGEEDPLILTLRNDMNLNAVFVESLNANYQVINATCPGSGDGSITVTPNGGTAPYSFDWGAFGTSDNGTLENLGAGTYPVTVTDANGLEHSLQAQVLDADTSAPVPDLSELPVVREKVIVRELPPPTATDACDGIITGTTDTELPIRASTTVTWTYTDSSGNSHSQEQEVRVEVDEITVYPNPVLDEGFWIAFPPSSTGVRYTATLYSSGGSLVAERDFEIGAASNSVRWDIDHVDWSNGTYLLVFRSNSGVEAVKLIKLPK